MKIAAAAYPLTRFDTWADYEAKLSHWVGEAAGQGPICWFSPNTAPWSWRPWAARRSVPTWRGRHGRCPR